MRKVRDPNGLPTSSAEGLPLMVTLKLPIKRKLHLTLKFRLTLKIRLSLWSRTTFVTGLNGMTTLPRHSST